MTLNKTLFAVIAGSTILATGSFFQAVAEKYASIVIEADSEEVLHARHADASRYPASLTKVMTLYMLFDGLKTGELGMEEKLTVSRFAASQAPSNIKLKTGDQIKVADAIEALVTKSANDVAVVVAERIGGTEARFARLMNAKAKALGMTSTNFRNASGLPNTRQKSTARDMSILAKAMIDDHPEYYHFFSNTKFEWNGKTYKSHNKLLGTVEGVDGMKTGYTRASGFNLMTSAERDGDRLIVVMLGGRTAKTRNAHVEDLLEAAFDTLGSSSTLVADAGKSFNQIEKTIHPDAAAEPRLNGRLLSEIIAEGDAETEPQPKVIKTVKAPAPTPKPKSTDTLSSISTALKTKPAPTKVTRTVTKTVTRTITKAPKVTRTTVTQTPALPSSTKSLEELQAESLAAATSQTDSQGKDLEAFAVTEYQRRQVNAALNN